MAPITSEPRGGCAAPPGSSRVAREPPWMNPGGGRGGVRPPPAYGVAARLPRVGRWPRATLEVAGAWAPQVSGWRANLLLGPYANLL
jgi:hypothetical protein